MNEDISKQSLSTFKKFKITYFWGVGVWCTILIPFYFIVKVPTKIIFTTLVGILVINLITGVVGALIKSQKKRVFVTIPIFITLLILLIAGSNQ